MTYSSSTAASHTCALCVSVLLLSFAFACSTTPPKEDTPKPDPSLAQSAQPKVRPDTDARFKRPSVKTMRKERGAGQPRVLKAAKSADASWWLVERPTARANSVCETFHAPTRPDVRILPIQASVRGSWMPSSAQRLKEYGEQLVVRIPNAVPETLEIVARSRPCSYYSSEPRTYFEEATWAISSKDLPRKKVRGDDALIQSLFWEAAASNIQNRQTFAPVNMWSAGTHPYTSFAVARSRALAETLRNPPKTSRGKPKRGATPTTPVRPRRRSDLGDTMSLYTGVSSMEEALQYDRGLRLNRVSEPSTIPVSSLKGVPLPEHPWAKMIASLPNPPVVEQMASNVPDDMIYIFAHDLRDLASISRELDTWLTPLSLALEQRAGTSDVMRRYEEQLILERRGLVEKFGNLAAKSAAIVSSDPFLREGSDVSILFQVSNANLLQNTLNTYVANAKGRHATLTTTTIDLGKGVQGTLTATTDKRLHQVRVFVNNVLIVSNSPNAARRIVETIQGTRASLKDSGDYQFMRGMYPAQDDKEDLFIFVGDKVVQNAVSPRTKILQSRRMRARADMNAVGYGAILHAWAHKTPVASIQEVVDSGILNMQDLTVALDKSPITYDAKRGSTSSAWGNSDMLTPIIDLSIDKVSKSEAEAYQAFQRTYQSYWRSFIDPIAVRVKRDEASNTFELDGRMLPLIESSEYNELVELVGQKTITTPTTPNAAQWSFAVGENARLRRELNQELRSVVMTRDVNLDWLGDWITLGTADRSALWDAAYITGAFPKLEHDQSTSMERALLEMLPEFPFYVGAHIRNPAAFALVLVGLRRELKGILGDMVKWETEEPYRDVSIQAIRVDLSQFESSFTKPIVLRYAIAKNTVFASFNLGVLEARIDDALDGRLPKVSDMSKDPKALQTFISFQPKEQGTSWISRTLMGAMENINVSNANQASFAWSDVAHTIPNAAKDPAVHRAGALGLLGVVPMTAHEELWSPATYGAQSALYGTAIAPKLPAVPVENSPLSALFSSLDSLNMGIAFEKIADHQGLRVRLKWSR